MRLFGVAGFPFDGHFLSEEARKNNWLAAFSILILFKEFKKYWGGNVIKLRGRVTRSREVSELKTFVDSLIPEGNIFDENYFLLNLKMIE